MMWSSLPGRRRALSKQSGLFVAATTITSLLHTSWKSSCQRGETVYSINSSLNTSHWSNVVWWDGKRSKIKLFNLILCVIVICTLKDFLCPSALHRLQANSIHLIQENRQKACLYTVRCLTVRPWANQRVNLIKEQDTGRTGSCLAKELRVGKQAVRQEDTITAAFHVCYYTLGKENTCAKAFSESPTKGE